MYAIRSYYVNYDINNNKFKNIFKEGNELAIKYGLPTISIGSLDLESRGVKDLYESPAAQLSYLNEIDKVPKPKYKKTDIDPELHKFIKSGYQDSRLLANNVITSYSIHYTKLYDGKCCISDNTSNV